MTRWTIRSNRDVQTLWVDVREVPRRIDGRKHYHEERYALGVYLSALAQHGLLDFPITVEQGESPDFILTSSSGEPVGLEVTRATEQWLQRKMTAMEREYRQKELAAKPGTEVEPVAIALSEHGWAGDTPEKQWCELVRDAIERKIAKLSQFRPASRHDLIVSDDTPLPAVDRQKVMAILVPWARDLKSNWSSLGRISIVVSLDVLFDVGGESKILPFVHWSTPEIDESPFGIQTFSEKVAMAGQAAVERAIREPTQIRWPGYYVRADGHIVKQNADGRRFQVRINGEGGEVIVKELPSA